MRWIYLMLLMSWVAFAHANEHCETKNIKTFYDYLKEKGPILNEVNKRKEQFQSEINLAEQRPNPELSLDYLKGDQFGIDINTYTLTAQHVIEFGSKRDKRIAKAKVFKALSSSQVDLNLYNSNANATLIYQKVAQLEILIKAVREASETFDKIVKKLSSRKRLNPEETVSLSTLKLASNDYKAQLNDLENQKNIFEGKVQFLSNCSNPKINHHEFKFPHLKSSQNNTEKTGLIKLEDFKVNLANEEFEVQKSLGYSNIQVGPTFEFQNQGNDEFVSAGVSVSFALPLFHTNYGGKLKALRGLETQRVESNNNKKMLLIERENLLKKYQRSLLTYKNMPSLKDLERKHLEVESLFSRGIVSIPMTIESHRQQVDFLKSRFEIENDLLATYTNINLIDGDFNGFDELFK